MGHERINQEVQVFLLRLMKQRHQIQIIFNQNYYRLEHRRVESNFNLVLIPFHQLIMRLNEELEKIPLAVQLLE